jgi:transcriptional regulator with XRE-family HTH domain
MGQHGQPLDRDGSPTRELAYWLRDLRRQSGLTVEQLTRRTRFASSTLYDAFRGKQLPSQRVTLSVVTACEGDVEAWRSYWAQIRRALDRDPPDGVERAVIPPWAGPAVRLDNTNESGLPRW